MTKRYRVKYEPLAKTALEEAVDFIRKDSGVDRAADWLRAVLESVEKLETLPKVYGVWTSREGQPVHSKLVASYRVFYVVDDSTSKVHVIDVVHTARETRLAQYRDLPG